MATNKGWRHSHPNTNEIMVLSSFFQRGFDLPCEFHPNLLYYYKIELVHLNPNLILQITIFVHLCKCYLVVHPNFSLFKHYFFLKYQPSATKWKIKGGVSIQTHPHRNFLYLPLKSSLKGWHKQWFYWENHQPILLPFIDHLPEYNGTWVEEPIEFEMPLVIALASRVSELKGHGLTEVSMATN
jgi:hypothetical protein